MEAEAEDDPASHTSSDAILRDFRYKLQCMFMEPHRDFRVGWAKTVMSGPITRSMSNQSDSAGNNHTIVL